MSLRHAVALATITALLALGLGLGVTARPVEAVLVQLTGVSTTRLQAGHPLRIGGEGLPAGRVAEVRLEGLVHRPGRAPRPVDFRATGTVPTREAVEVAMPADALRALGTWGTFHGTIEVAFDATSVDARVLGRLPRVTLDLVPSSLPAPTRTTPFATRLGLEVAATDEGEGLLVQRVVDGGRGAAAGLAEGDVLVSLEGLHLTTPEAFEPPPDATDVVLTVTPAGQRAHVPVRLSLEGLDGTIPRARLAWLQLAVLAWLAAALFVGPTGAFLDRLTLPRVSKAAWPAWLLAGALGIAMRLGFDAWPSLGLDAALTTLVFARAAWSVVNAAPGARLGVSIRGGAGILAALGGLGAATLAIGSTSAAAIEAAQGPWPWAWTALRGPAGALAALAFGVASACGPLVRHARGRVRAVDDGFVVGLATLAVIALGGGRSAVAAIADLRPTAAPIGWVLFGAAVAATTSLMRRARDRGALARASWLFGASGLAAGCAMAAALGWSELRVPPEVERAIGEGLLVLGAMFVLRVATARPPAPARPMHAML